MLPGKGVHTARIPSLCFPSLQNIIPSNLSCFAIPEYPNFSLQVDETPEGLFSFHTPYSTLSAWSISGSDHAAYESANGLRQKQYEMSCLVQWVSLLPEIVDPLDTGSFNSSIFCSVFAIVFIMKIGVF